MKNEGLKNGMIELLLATVLLFLIIELPTSAAVVLLVCVILGAVVLLVWKEKQKREFPVLFFKPDGQLRERISDYYERVEYSVDTKNKSDTWIFVVIMSFCFILGIQMYVWSKSSKMMIVMLVFLICVVCVFLIVNFGSDYMIARKLKVAKIADFEVAEVEFYDASYDHHGKNANVKYYVYVKKNGENMKLQVAEHVFHDITSQQNGTGYLIKNPNGNGFFDVFDFIPNQM